MAIDPGNPRRFLRSIKWKKAMEGFFHGQPAQDAMAIKWKKAMEGFFHGQLELQTQAAMPRTVFRRGIHHRGLVQP
jgi:hypothetical protein